MPEPPDRLEVDRVAITSVLRYAIPTTISGWLRILDLERGRVSFVTPSPESTFRQQDPNPRGGTRGTRGVSAHDDRLVVANAERVFVFDASWRLVAEFSDRLMADVHGVLAEERGIWITATGTDTLLLVSWEGRLERVWKLGADRALMRELGFRRSSLGRINPALDLRDPRLRGPNHDYLHLNGLGRSGDSLLLCLGRVQPTKPEPGPMESALVRLTENGDGPPRLSLLHRRPGIRVPSHDVAEDGGLLLFNDSTDESFVAVDVASGEMRCAIRVPGSPPYVRGLARIGPDLWLAGSQAPLAVHAIDLRRAQVVASYPLAGIQDEVVFGICPIPAAFGSPRQPLGDDPYEFWRRAAGTGA